MSDAYLVMTNSSSDHRPQLPPIPSRSRVCRLRTTLQGLSYHTREFGVIPAGWFWLLSPEDRKVAYTAHRAAGDTHIPIDISGAYLEPGTSWPDKLLEGRDFTNDLPALKAILREMIVEGFCPDLPLAGDGMSVNDDPQFGQYNDPVGKTYGYQWLIQNLGTVLEFLQNGEDLTPYILFRPGWDAVFYGWGVAGEVPDQQPERVRRFGELFRQHLPVGHLAIQHNTGHLPVGSGPADYAVGGAMQTYDTILSEFDSVHEDSCWQVVARMIGPMYVKPTDQPVHDDPTPPWYLRPLTPRGEYVYVAFEWTKAGAYAWCRGQCTAEDVQRVRAYVIAMGCRVTG